LLRPPGRMGVKPTVAKAAHSSEPYLEVQLLQLVDGSLPRLVGGEHPLKLAVEFGQEQLVRMYLSLDVAEAMPPHEQAVCLSLAIARRDYSILAQLLDQMRPSHQHLLAALRLRAVDLVEALLQAGGSALLHPRPSGGSSSSSGARGSNGRGAARRTARGEVGGGRNMSAGLARRDGVAGAIAAGGGSTTTTLPPEASGERRGQQSQCLTPLSVACSLGDVAMVEALCQWARREKAHIDPTAPLFLGPEGSQTVGPGGRLGEGLSAGSSPGLWDRGDGGPEGRQCFGDPPMVMAVRGQGSLATKLSLISTLARYGFTADVRSTVDGWTPLLAAVELGSLELVAALTKIGARLTADRHVGFTPVHLACQMGHWALVPCLTEAMQAQYNRVAAWGPSPQYVSLNSVDAYGRTALDVALLRYFSNPLPCCSESSGKPPSLGSERQKAVDILREFVHRSPPDDPGVVCGWELLRVLRFLDALPSRKGGGLQLWGPGDWEHTAAAAAGVSGAAAYACAESAAGSRPTHRLGKAGVAEQQEIVLGSREPSYSDVEELLQSVRVMVHAGAQTRWLLQDLVQPPSRGLGRGSADRDRDSVADDSREASVTFWSRQRIRTDGSTRYNPVDQEDTDLSPEDAGPE